MKQKLLLKTMLLLCALVVGSSSVWADDSYTITFANSVSSATAITSSTTANSTIAAASREFVTTQPYTVNSGNCYYGDTQTCIRIGKSGNASSLSIALSDDGKVNATTIVVNCNNTGGTKNSDATLSVNGKTAQTTTETAKDYTFNINENIESITLAGSASIKIYSITVNYATTPAESLSIDFETNDLSSYVNWVFLNIATKTHSSNSDISAHGGSYWGNTDGKSTASITTKAKVAYPGTFTCYISKESGNTTSSNWKIQVSSDKSTWTDVETMSAAGMAKGEWQEFTADLSAHTNVYVRLSYGSSTAIRAVDDIVLTEYVPITITCEGGYASYSCDRDLDFSNSNIGAEAYIIKSTSANSATLTQVNKVPANTGIIVKGTKGETVNVPIATGIMDDVTGNLLHGTVNTPTAVAQDEAYGLSKADGLFHLMNAGTIPVNKAYLLASEVFQSQGGGAPVLGLEFSNGEVTAIDDVRSKMEDVRSDFYNLNGQRVAQPTKGLYIVNGKKYIVK